MYYQDFKRSNPPSHHGAIDGITVEEWFMQFEKIFDAMYAPDDDKRVKLSALCFKDLVKTWW